jgi:formate hydrogenlyase transcriptional activator
MPSLRERIDDIPLLVEYLIERYARNAGKTINSISKKTMELFQRYEWPGNVRELQNVIERAPDGAQLLRAALHFADPCDDC